MQQSFSATQPSANHASTSLKDYARIILLRRWLVLLVFLVILAATVYYLYTTTPVYKTHVIMMRESGDQIPSAMLQVRVVPRDTIAGHMELLRSNLSTAQVQQQLMTEHGINITPSEIRRSFSLETASDNAVVRLVASAAEPQRAQALANTLAQFYIQQMSDMKRADTDRGVNFLKTQMELVQTRLQQAEEALNAFREQEALFTVTSTQEGTQNRGLFAKLAGMQDQLATAELDLEWTQAQLSSVQGLIDEKRQLSLSDLSGSSPSQIDQIQAKLVDLQLQRDTLLEQLTEKTPEVAAVQQQINALQKRLDAQLTAMFQDGGQTGTDPVAELQGLFQQVITLQAQARGYEQKVTLLKEHIALFRIEHPELVSKQVELLRLERQARVHEQTYITLLANYEELRLLKEMKTTGLRILDQAPLPTTPVHPQKLRILLFGTMLGLMLAIGLAFFLEYLDDSLRIREDIDRHLGLPVLGTIPRISALAVPPEALSFRSPDGNGNGSPEVTNAGQLHRHKHSKGYRKRIQRLLGSIILYANHRSPLHNHYRTLAANIRYANIDAPVQKILMTSSLPSEGKTATTANLAISMANTNLKVLLVDADLRRPKQHRIFQQERSPGLTDLLVEEAEDPGTGIELGASPISASMMESCLRTTAVEDLWLLPCGKHMSNPESLLSSMKMTQLLKLLGDQFDIVLFDSPPVMAAADAMILSTLMDTSLVVVRSGETKRAMALQAREMIENVDGTVLGVVLNDVDYSRLYGSYYYYYYRSYYSGYGYSTEEDEG